MRTLISARAAIMGALCLGVLAGWAADARACECVGGAPACVAAPRARAVFVGRVAGWAAGEVLFDVERAIRGVKRGRIRLDSGSGNCAFPFRTGINFDSDADTIRAELRPTLDRIVAKLKANADLNITIEGHTDSTSTPEHNQQLSERRAMAVKQHLTTAGIQADRLEATGFGATKPVATNSTPLGRAANRRVELVKR